MIAGQKWKVIGLLAVILLPAIWLGYRYYAQGRQPLSHRQVATRVLAEHLKTAYQPKRALIFSNPYAKMSGRPPEVYSFQEAGEEGLREGFGPGVQLKTVFPPIRPAALKDVSSVYVDPESSTPISFLVTEYSWQEALEKNPSFQMAISLIGAPLNYRDLIKNPSFAKIKFAFLLPDWRMIGDATAIKREFASGRIAAAVINRQGAESEKSLSGNYKKDFERLFILVTPQNLSQLFP
ncbi:MAG: hypothetical protein ACO1QB_11515 [Verrucomicrobiales bacterium]